MWKSLGRREFYINYFSNAISTSVNIKISMEFSQIRKS